MNPLAECVCFICAILIAGIAGWLIRDRKKTRDWEDGYGDGYDAGWIAHNEHREKLLARERKRRSPIGRYTAKVRINPDGSMRSLDASTDTLNRTTT